MTFEPDVCACSPPLLRRCLAVENLHGAGQRVMACLRCGAATAVRDRVEDIPYDDYGRVRVVGVDVVPLSAAALAWLSSWPRLVPLNAGEYWDANTSAFLPASTRVSDEAELTRLEQQAKEQRAANYEARLRAAGVPAEPPPPGTEALFGFVVRAWQMLQLSPATDSEALLERMKGLREPSAWIAASRLPPRAELAQKMAELLARSSDAERELALSNLEVLRATPTSALQLPEPLLAAFANLLRSLAGEEKIRERRLALRWLEQPRDEPERLALQQLLGADAEALFDTDPFAPHRAGKPFR
jgi:hypothetical protein